MIIGSIGLKHVLNNDARRKALRTKISYAAYCRANRLFPSLLGLSDSIEDTKKIWFSMSHDVAPEALFETAKRMKEDYADFKEVDSAQNLSMMKNIRLLFWFDNNRLISLMSIAVALLSVLALVGVKDANLIVQAFFQDVFPVMISCFLFIFFGYLMFFFMTPVISVALSFWDLLLVRMLRDLTDRSINRYIYDMMQASD